MIEYVVGYCIHCSKIYIINIYKDLLKIYKIDIFL